METKTAVRRGRTAEELRGKVHRPGDRYSLDLTLGMKPDTRGTEGKNQHHRLGSNPENSFIAPGHGAIRTSLRRKNGSLHAFARKTRLLTSVPARSDNGLINSGLQAPLRFALEVSRPAHPRDPKPRSETSPVLPSPCPAHHLQGGDRALHQPSCARHPIS
jgi:hypothetical protein